MIRRFEAMLIFSENPRSLAEFYRDKVGLKITMEMEMGEEGKEEAFELSGGEGNSIYIGHHSEVHGKNKEPQRIMFNLEVDDIEKEVEKVEREGIKKIQDIYHIEEYGMIATFEDPDGNYFQLVQIRESGN